MVWPDRQAIHILLTKADKLTRTEALKVLQATRKELAPWADQVSVQLFSSLKKTGGEEAEKVIGRWLELAEDTEEKRNAPG